MTEDCYLAAKRSKVKYVVAERQYKRMILLEFHPEPSPESLQ